MTDQEGKSDQSLSKVVGQYLGFAGQIFGFVAGSLGLLYAIGFAVVNISLLSYGVFEIDLVRARYISSGVSYIVLFAILIGVALTALFFLDRWFDKESPLPILIGILPVAVVSYILALSVWGFKGWLRFSLSFLIWCIGMGLVILVVAGRDRLAWTAEHLVYQRAKLTQLSAEKKPKVLAAWSILGVILLILVFFYGQNAYATFPPALGGGLPIVVQFSGEADSMASLEQLGVDLETPALTSKVELIGQTTTKYIILVRDEALGGDLAVAFDKSFVQGIRYYPERFFLDPEYDAEKRTRDGDAYRQQGNLDRAIYEYEEALRRFSDYAPARLGKAEALREKGVLADAIVEYQKVIKLAPDTPEAYYGLARAHALVKIQDPSQDAAEGAAIENLQIAVQKDEDYLERAKTEVDFRDLSKTDKFIELIFQGAQNAMIWYGGEGDRQRDAENLDAAQAAYESALALAERVGEDSDQANYQNRLGQLYWQKDDIQNAKGYFEEAIALEPTNAKYRFDLGNFYVSQEAWSRALILYDQALDIDPGYVAALVAKGKVLVAQEEPDHAAAEDTFSAAILLQPNNSAAYFGRAIVRAYLGRAPEASADLRRAIALNTDLISRAESEPAFKDIQGAISPLLSAAENFKDGNQLAAEGK
ncbi:MAG: tetratricopeptide repeat protein, partial [Anaerolineales bacterium]